MAILLRRANDIPTAPLDDSLLMLNIARGQYHSLNDVGARVWELLAEPTTRDTLVERLVEEFDVEQDVCGAEVDAFIGELSERGLLVREA
jgi:hypothetical protein